MGVIKRFLVEFKLVRVKMYSRGRTFLLMGKNLKCQSRPLRRFLSNSSSPLAALGGQMRCVHFLPSFHSSVTFQPEVEYRQKTIFDLEREKKWDIKTVYSVESGNNDDDDDNDYQATSSKSHGNPSNSNNGNNNSNNSDNDNNNNNNNRKSNLFYNHAKKSHFQRHPSYLGWRNFPHSFLVTANAILQDENIKMNVDHSEKNRPLHPMTTLENRSRPSISTTNSKRQNSAAFPSHTQNVETEDN